MALFLLMIVNDFNIVGTIRRPDKTDAPLIIDPDRVLPGAVSPEQFEPVAGRTAQIVQPHGGIQHFQLALGDPLNLNKSPGATAIEQAFCVLTGK
jgi:hypothetical protein